MSDSELNLVNQLAEEFLERLRRGERPSVAEFTARCPDHADEIRELFPTLRVLEEAGTTPVKSTVANLGMELPVPSQLGDYSILREVARGGMGVVYEAEQQALGRRVALKVLSASAARKPQNLIRFRREARSASRLHHTNIVPVYDIGCEQGIHFYTMQLIGGTSLDQVIVELLRMRQQADPSTADENADRLPEQDDGSCRRIVRNLVSRGFSDSTSAGSDPRLSQPVVANGELPSTSADSKSGSSGTGNWNRSSPHFYRNVARIGLQVADALAYAHGHKLLHRDVKPSNLLLDEQGNVWVTDFGLVKDEELELTATGDLVGTLRYMPPERFQGTVDARGDLYSLGLTLYELLTLRTCLPRTDRPGALRLDAPRDLPAPRKCDPRIPSDLEIIVLKAMEHEPSRRYSRAEALADDLRRFLSDRPILARRATWIEHIWMWCRRNRALAATATVAGILLIVSCLGWAASHILRGQRDLAVRAEQSAQAHEHLARAMSHCVSGRSGGRWQALDEIRKAVRLNPAEPLRSALRDQAVAALAMTDVHVESIRWADLLPADETIDFASIQYGSLAFSRDYRRYAMVRPGSDSIAIVDRASRRILRELPNPNPGAALNFTKSGSLLVGTGQNAGSFLSVWDTTTGQLLYHAEQQFGNDVSPDDHWLAVGQRDGTIRLIDLKNPENVRSIAAEHAPWSLAFSPDGASLAACFSGDAPFVSIFDCNSLKRVQQLDSGRAISITWHPGGSKLVVTAGFRAQIWNVAREELLATTEDSLNTLDSCAVSSDGTFLLTGTWDGTTRLWDMNSLQPILTMERKVVPGWSPDGTILGWRATDEGMELVHLERSPFRFTLPSTRRPGETPFSGGFSSDGQLACAMYSNDARNGRLLELVNTQTRQLVGMTVTDQASAFSFGPRDERFTILHGREFSRLPIRSAADNQRIIGPPQSFPLPGLPIRSRISTDGSTCAMLYDNKLHILPVIEQVAIPGETRNLLDEVAVRDLPHDHDAVAISGDGKWAATGHWHSHFVSVWNLSNGHSENLVANTPLSSVESPGAPGGVRGTPDSGAASNANLPSELFIGSQTFFSFSPISSLHHSAPHDSASFPAPQLITSRSDAYRFWTLPALENVLTLRRTDCPQPDPIAVDSTGRLTVACLRPDELDLVDLRSGETRLRIRRPSQGRSWFLAFHPNGTSFLEGLKPDNVLVLWDLVALQRELKVLGLVLEDWGLPQSDSPKSVARVTFEGTENWAAPAFIGLMNEADARARLESLNRIVQANPDSAEAANRMAWELFMAPPALRDVERAVKLAESAAKQDSASVAVRNTLAAACYRAGQFERAIELLDKNIANNTDTDLPWDLFLLSMCHSAQGHPEVAENYFQMAQRWSRTKNGDTPLIRPEMQPELQHLQAEARAALDGKKAE